MPRRGENIYKRKDGRWEGRIRQKAALNNKRKYRSVYGKTYNEVKKKLENAKRELSNQLDDCDLHMKEAVNIWYADKRNYWKESTYAAYRQTIEKYVLPSLGEKSLSKIDNFVMSDFVAEIQAKNPECKLSITHLCYICSVVLRIMTYIKKKTGSTMVIPDNPVQLERKPGIILPDAKDLSKLETYLFKNIHDDTCLGILAALHTGLRIGELCALTWGDIDLEAGVLHIRNNIQRIRDYEEQENKTRLLLSSPKTIYSIRDIPIPPALFEILKSCQKDSACHLISGIRGEWMDPRTLQYRFRKILQVCDIEYFNFHMLRHAFATRCMEKGFDSKSLSEILGHSSIQITLNLYVHSTFQQKKRLMDLMGTYSE